jgi:hypothetical protein
MTPRHVNSSTVTRERWAIYQRARLDFYFTVVLLLTLPIGVDRWALVMVKRSIGKDDRDEGAEGAHYVGQ